MKKGVKLPSSGGRRNFPLLPGGVGDAWCAATVAAGEARPGAPATTPLRLPAPSGQGRRACGTAGYPRARPGWSLHNAQGFNLTGGGGGVAPGTLFKCRFELFTRGQTAALLRPQQRPAPGATQPHTFTVFPCLLKESDTSPRKTPNPHPPLSLPGHKSHRPPPPPQGRAGNQQSLAVCPGHGTAEGKLG